MLVSSVISVPVVIIHIGVAARPPCVINISYAERCRKAEVLEHMTHDLCICEIIISSKFRNSTEMNDHEIQRKESTY